MKKKKRGIPFWRNPRFRYGSLSTLILCVALAALIALNVLVTGLEKRGGWRLDFSFNGLTTQSETTLNVLRELPYPVHIYALFSRGDEDQPLLELLDRYAAASPLVTWEQTDVSLNPGLLTRFHSEESSQTVTNNSVIVSCEETGRWQVLDPTDFISLSLDYEAGYYTYAGLTYESKITSAIAYVTRKTIPRIIAAQGHGELDAETAAALEELLEANHYDVQFGRLSEFELTADDLVMLLSPVMDLSDSELETLSAFAEQGGGFLFTCDYSDPIERMPNYAALLRSFGFLPKDGVVVASADEPDTYYNNVRISLIPYMLLGETTDGLIGDGYNTLLLTGCRAFETPEETDANLYVTPVLSSGARAYLHDMEGELSIEQQDGDELGPFALALEARRITAEGNVSRAFALGCSTLLTSAQVHVMTDAQEFILRVTQFLLDEAPSDLGIMAKEAVRPALSVRSATLGSLLLVALPVAVVAAAVIVLVPRRRR